MARSGVSVSEQLGKQFVELSDSKDIAWIKVQIDEEPAFKLIETGKTSDPKAEFEELKGHLPPKEPAYFLYRVANQNKWLIVFWVPDVSKVKDRMIYASSVADLQKGFGQAKFVPVAIYRISEPKECAWDQYSRTLQEIDQVELLTSEELMAQEARMDSASSMGGSRVSAIVGMPVKVKDEAGASLAQVASGAVTTLILQLNPETEVLESVEEGNISLEEVSKKMTRKDPRFIVHNFKHEREEKQITSTIFIYYCPDGAKPRLKMFYSSCKNVIVQIVTNAGVTIAKSLEGSEPGELSSQTVLDELYPKQVVKKTFEKPKSKSGRRMIGGAKFSASPVSPSSPDSPDAAE